MPKYSVVIPVYNEEVFLSDFYNKLKEVIKEPRAFEVIFVNDGSTDYSLKILTYICEQNSNVKIINLKQNYGKQIAITAGMAEATGDAVIVLSIKAGNPFEAIDALVSSYQNGNEIVFAYRNTKKSKLSVMWANFKRNCLNFIMRLFNINGNLVKRPDAELYDRKVVDVLNELKDKNMYLRRVDALFGFKRQNVLFNTNMLSKKELEEIKMHKFDFIGERISNNEREPKKLKTRHYIKSLWTSLFLFIASSLLFVGSALVIIFSVNALLALIGIIASIATFMLSLTYYFKSVLIKRVGVFLPKNKQLYEIVNILN